MKYNLIIFRAAMNLKIYLKLQDVNWLVLLNSKCTSLLTKIDLKYSLRNKPRNKLCLILL